MKWFKHKTNSSDREFLTELEDIFGLEGYARWFKLLERIGQTMGGENGCSVAYPWSKWQTFLKGKRNKLETFLVHLENKQRINRKLTGNILEIECPKLLEIRDEYSKRSGHTTDNVPPRSKSKEVRVQSKDLKPIEHPEPDAPHRFQITGNRHKFRDDFEKIWDAYPEKKGKAKAWLRYKAQVTTIKDSIAIVLALVHYKHDVEQIRDNGQPDLRWQYGSTWFNSNWKDFIHYKPPPEHPKTSKKTTFQNKRDVADNWLKESKENDQRRVSPGTENIPELRGSEPGQGDTGSVVPDADKRPP